MSESSSVERFSTADLHDAQPDAVEVIDLQFRCFGRRRYFFGEVETVVAFEDHAPVRDAVADAGRGRVLLVDGGASLRVGLMGDRVASTAIANGWAGIVVVGAIRDGEVVDQLEIGVRALGTTARRSIAERKGLQGISVFVGGVLCRPGNFLYADQDSVLVSHTALDLAPARLASAPPNGADSSR